MSSHVTSHILVRISNAVLMTILIRTVSLLTEKLLRQNNFRFLNLLEPELQLFTHKNVKVYHANDSQYYLASFIKRFAPRPAASSCIFVVFNE